MVQRVNQPQPIRHYGFAQVPRLITRGKKYNLSLIEKGLYACLKDICGDEGECFYTLRHLAAEINTSISTLSRYIPKLQSHGLIDAEKKPCFKNGHEIWHIRIVNIWEENDKLYGAHSSLLQTMPYKEYLQTPHWESIRKEKLKQEKYTCQICNAQGTLLNVHHRTYERRGREKLTDLIVLCHQCHEIFHQNGKLAQPEGGR